MPKFREGDMVYFIRDTLEGTKTEIHCGLDEPMEKAIGGVPLTVEIIGDNINYQSYSLSSPIFGTERYWWFHENDLDFFNLSFENK